MSSPRLSADGLFYWDGKQWVSALSSDGRHRWDGSSWLPILTPPVYMPQHAFVPDRPPLARMKPLRLVTASTRWLQAATVAFFGLVGTWWIAMTAVAAVNVPDFVTRFIAQQEALHPDQPLPPPGYDTGMIDSIFFGLALAAVVVVGLVIAIVVGTARRWTWAHDAVVIVLGLQVLFLPLAFADVFSFSSALDGLHVGGLLRWGAIALGVAAIALLAWMVVARLRTGPWAMRGSLSGQQ